MLNPVQIFWSPIGVTMPSLDTKALVDIHDGDTPSIRMPVRMLSIDTPEVTADTAESQQLTRALAPRRWRWFGTAPPKPASSRSRRDRWPTIRGISR